MEWVNREIREMSFNFLFNKFKTYYLPRIFPDFSTKTNIYDPRLGKIYLQLIYEWWFYFNVFKSWEVEFRYFKAFKKGLCKLQKLVYKKGKSMTIISSECRRSSFLEFEKKT